MTGLVSLALSHNAAPLASGDEFLVNFAELRLAELLRICLPRTPVNKLRSAGPTHLGRPTLSIEGLSGSGSGTVGKRLGSLFVFEPPVHPLKPRCNGSLIGSLAL